MACDDPSTTDPFNSRPIVPPAARGIAIAAIVTTAFFSAKAIADTNDGPSETDIPAVLDFQFDAVSPLPDGEGLAGAIAGRSGTTLIVAGGANFPDTPRWETDKVWYDTIQTLDLAADGPRWETLADSLDGPVAYGVSLTHPRHGVLSIGGANSTSHLTSCFALSMEDGELVRTGLPDLPIPLAYAAGTLDGDTVVIMGGQSSPGGPASDAVLLLDLGADTPKWERGPPIPSGGRILPVAATHRGEVMLFSGVALEPDGDGGHRRVSPYLVEAWKLDRASDSSPWIRLADLPRPTAAAASPAINVGFDLLAIVGGDDGANLQKINQLKDDHPGFPEDVLVYHSVTDRWTTRGSFPGNREAGIQVPVTAATIPITGTRARPSMAAP